MTPSRPWHRPIASSNANSRVFHQEPVNAAWSLYALPVHLFRMLPDRGSSRSTGGTSARDEDRKSLFVYERLTDHLISQETLLWQTPALALTAQAFLLTIALNTSSSALMVVSVSFLGALVAAMSWQLMSKHQFLAQLDRAYLHYLEDSLGIPHISNRGYFPHRPHSVPDHLEGRGAPNRPSLMARLPSFRVWRWGMIVFLLFNLVLVALNIVPAVRQLTDSLPTHLH